MPLPTGSSAPPAPPRVQSAEFSTGSDLLAALRPNLEPGAVGVFGICYSVLTFWDGLMKGCDLTSGEWWLKTAGKLFENGHATTFLINRNSQTITLTGIATRAWVFDEGNLDGKYWARKTGSTTTYVYYIGVNEAFLRKYASVKGELTDQVTSYAVLCPNLPFAAPKYQNCVSHSQYLLSKLGLGVWTSSKGWWIPSVSNWWDWFKSFVPTQHEGFRWNYKVFEGMNTHITRDHILAAAPVVRPTTATTAAAAAAAGATALPQGSLVRRPHRGARPE